jgi:hypothetical protein
VEQAGFAPVGGSYHFASSPEKKHIKETSDDQRAQESNRPVNEDTQDGLEFLVGVVGDIPRADEVTADGTGHEIVVKPTQEIKFDGGPERDRDSLRSEQQPPAESDYYVAGGENAEGGRKDKRIYAGKDFGELGPRLLGVNPVYGPSDSAGHDGKTDDRKQIPS